MYWLNEILQWSAIGVMGILMVILWLSKNFQDEDPDFHYTAAEAAKRELELERLAKSCQRVKDLGPSL